MSIVLLVQFALLACSDEASEGPLPTHPCSFLLRRNVFLCCCEPRLSTSSVMNVLPQRGGRDQLLFSPCLHDNNPLEMVSFSCRRFRKKVLKTIICNACMSNQHVRCKHSASFQPFLVRDTRNVSGDQNDAAVNGHFVLEVL